MKKNFHNFLMGSAMFELANDPGTARPAKNSKSNQ